MSAETKNTDKRIWKKIPGDAFSPSIHVTEQNTISIDIAGHVISAPVEVWHESMNMMLSLKMLSWWRRKWIIAMLNHATYLHKKRMMKRVCDGK